MMESFDNVLHLPSQSVSVEHESVIRCDRLHDYPALSADPNFHKSTTSNKKPAKGQSLRTFKRKMYSLFFKVLAQSECPVRPLPLEYTVQYSDCRPIYCVEYARSVVPRAIPSASYFDRLKKFTEPIAPQTQSVGEEDPRQNLYPTSTSISNWKKIFSGGRMIYNLKLSNGSDVPISTYEEFARLVKAHCLTNPRLTMTGLLNGGGRRKRRNQRKKKTRPNVSTSVVKTSGNLNVGRSMPPQTARNVWTYISNVSSDAAGKFSFYTNIRNPAKAINGSGQFVRAVEDAKIWDGYYVQSYTIQMVPIFPTTVTSGLVVAAVDQEGTSPVSTPSYDTLIDRRYRSMFFGRQARTFTIRPKPLTSGTFEGRVCPIIELGKKLFYDYEFPPDQGIFEVAGENFAPNSALYQIFLYMNVVNYSPRTLPGTAPRVEITTGPGGTIVPNPAPLAPLRRPRSRSV